MGRDDDLRTRTGQGKRRGASDARVPTRDKRPYACLEGLIYIGRLEMTEESEEVEVVQAVACKRCKLH
jgi:hypothetical protein